MFPSHGAVTFGLSASFSVPPEPALINDATRQPVRAYECRLGLTLTALRRYP